MTDLNQDFAARLKALREEVARRIAETSGADPEEAAKAQAWEDAQAAAAKPQRTRPKMTATERKHYDELRRLVPETMMAFHWPELAHAVLPEEWKDIPADPKPDKARITLRVDADVLRFFRKTGRGYQGRMNDVLRTFMLAKLVDIVGIGRQPLGLMMAQDAKQKTALDREAQLVRELEALRRKRTGIG